MIQRLSTPLARGLALATVAVGLGSAAWRYSEAPPGRMMDTVARTVSVTSRVSGILFLPGSTVVPVDPPELDIVLSDIGLQPQYCPARTDEPWPPGIPERIEYWGVFLCNDAQAPASFLEEMKPYLRDAALRDAGKFGSRVIAIPLAGLMGAAAFLAAAMTVLRAGRWIRTGT